MRGRFLPAGQMGNSFASKGFSTLFPPGLIHHISRFHLLEKPTEVKVTAEVIKAAFVRSRIATNHRQNNL
jgi:hypothetical protein